MSKSESETILTGASIDFVGNQMYPVMIYTLIMQIACVYLSFRCHETNSAIDKR